MQTDGDAWLLDISKLTGCDEIVLRVIGSVYRRALRHGRRLAVVGAPRSLEAKLIRLRLNGHVLACDHSAPAADDRRLA